MAPGPFFPGGGSRPWKGGIRLTRVQLYAVILGATVSYAVPKVIDLLSQATLHLLQPLFQ